jgi:histidine triad (HIT) family protein
MDSVKKQPDSRTATAVLRKLTRGLLYMSESDEPFEIVRLEKPAGAFGAAEACLVTNRSPGCRVQEQSLEDFFSNLAQDRDWHGPPEKEDVRRYRELWHYFRDCLNESTVFQLGEIQVDIIIVGRAADGRWVGVKTRAIET